MVLGTEKVVFAGCSKDKPVDKSNFGSRRECLLGGMGKMGCSGFAQEAVIESAIHDTKLSSRSSNSATSVLNTLACL